MKKYILAIALIGLAGTVMAQKDITSQYITNATLANGTSGWTKTCTKNTTTNDPADAFSNSVRGNNTIGYASEAYAGWGSLIQTAYSMKQTITLPKGNYRLVNYSFFRQGENYNTNSSKSLAYLKAGSNQVALKTLGSITAAGYANSQAEGANCFDSKMYRNTLEFTIASDNTDIEIGIEGTFDEMRSWCIVGMFELFDLDDLASVSSPTDVTYAITNSSFEYRNLTGWTNNGMVYQDNNWEKKVGTGFVEKWMANPGLPDATLTQQLTNLPNGLYELAVNGHNINQGNGDAPSNGFFLTAGTAQKEIGAYGEYKVRATVTDGTLQIGLKLHGCTGNWVAADRFSLLFYGDPDAAVIELINTYINEANGLLNSTDAQYLTTSQKGTLQQAVSDAQTATSENRNERMEDLVNAIETARQQIQQVKDNRALMLAALERFESDYNLADGTDYSRVTMSAGAWTDLLAKVNAVATALDNISQASTYATKAQELVAQMDATDASLRLFKRYKAMSDGTRSFSSGGSVVGGSATDSEMDSDATEQDAITALNTAFVGYASQQTASFPASAFLGDNLNFNAPAGSVLNGDNSNTIKAVTGWEVGYNDADTWAVLQTDQNNNSGKLYMRKNWGSSATTLTATKEKMLPAGSYRLSLSWNSNMENMTNLSCYKLGDTKTAIGRKTTQAEKLTYDFTLTEPTPFDLVIGFQKNNKDNTPAQIIADDVELTYMLPLVFADGSVPTYAPGIYPTVKISRGLTANRWVTAVYPFAVQANDGLAVATLSSYNATTGELAFASAEASTPNVPFMMCSKAGTTEISLSNIEVEAANATVATASEASLIGVYASTAITNAEKNYVLSSNVIYPVGTAGATIPAYRAYIQISQSAGSARALHLVVDGVPTAIDGVEVVNDQNADVYNLSGQRVKNVKKGLYIQNGKKVAVK